MVRDANIGRKVAVFSPDYEPIGYGIISDYVVGYLYYNVNVKPEMVFTEKICLLDPKEDKEVVYGTQCYYEFVGDKVNGQSMI